MVSSLRGPFFLIYKPTPQQRFKRPNDLCLGLCPLMCGKALPFRQAIFLKLRRLRLRPSDQEA
ncbi:MAG: hypothetical protein QOG23_1876 [Blastocatellia bacterium]|nr:hypothetical protein [Blastocatellia bacterium]